MLKNKSRIDMVFSVEEIQNYVKMLGKEKTLFVWNDQPLQISARKQQLKQLIDLTAIQISILKHKLETLKKMEMEC